MGLGLSFNNKIFESNKREVLINYETTVSWRETSCLKTQKNKRKESFL
jgi:hypothetical protein